MVFTIRARVNGFSTLEVGGKTPAMARRTGPALLDSRNIHGIIVYRCTRMLHYDYLHSDSDCNWVPSYLTDRKKPARYVCSSGARFLN